MGTIGWLINKYCSSGKKAACCCSGYKLLRSVDGNSNLILKDLVSDGAGSVDTAYGVENMHLHADSVGRTGQADLGGLVKKIAKGG